MTLRIANCSGFYGDRLSAMREMIEGGPIDVVTGDYLAELTMLILGKDQLKDPSLGYARTFVKQVEDCIELALEKGVKIVSNAGGLNPAGLAEKLQDLGAKVAYVDGDNLVDRADELGLGKPLTANAYLGAFGIASALQRGADIVVTGRVTDASVVVGPAIAHYGWGPEEYDALAGAVVAGHIIECGTQATGGNFSGFRDLHRGKRQPLQPMGFPVAEIESDGTCVITKHAGTGGAVTVDTVSAQLVYEIQSTRYLGPDATVLLDTIQLTQDGEDRVRVAGARGEAPPETLKVCVNELGGFRNSIEFLLTGLEIDAKAEWLQLQMEQSWRGGKRPATVAWHESVQPRHDASNQDLAYSVLRCTVLDPSPDVAGKGLTGPAVELALASYPGFTLSAPPSPATPYGVYRPAYVPRSVVSHTVHHHDGTSEVIPDPAKVLPTQPAPELTTASELTEQVLDEVERTHNEPPPQTRRLPLGTFVHARSGDKGGDANLGLWVTHSDPEKYDARVAWLLDFVTVGRMGVLIPEARDRVIEVYPLSNLGGVNVLLHGLLGLGVAASTRVDPQAKALGEWVRSRHVDIPEELL